MPQVSWLLVAPPELGGRGIDPISVRQLSLYELFLFSRSAEQMGISFSNKKLTHQEAVEKARLVSPAKMAAAQEELARRREYYTGTREIQLKGR